MGQSFVKACEAGPIIVTRSGKPVAVLVGIEDENEISPPCACAHEYFATAQPDEVCWHATILPRYLA